MNSTAIKTFLLLISLFLTGTVQATIIDEMMKNFIRIDAGPFQMGSADCLAINEQPPHTIHLDTYFISKYEVTVAQYVYYLNQTGTDCGSKKDFHIKGNKGNYYVKKGEETFPITYVSWHDAVAFCKWLSKKSGKNIHLPTEAQWEKACRAGSSVERYGDLNDIAWYSNNSGRKTHRIGEKRPNGFGLYDMLGNVWEWCSDWYGRDYYMVSPARNPSGPTFGSGRVDRGGSRGSYAAQVRAGYRDRAPEAHRGRLLGFRPVYY